MSFNPVLLSVAWVTMIESDYNLIRINPHINLFIVTFYSN